MMLQNNYLKTTYEQLVSSGAIQLNPKQLSVITELDALLHALNAPANKTGWLAKLFAKEQPHLKGLYIYGSVGSGKTMLMDLFYDSVNLVKKRRSHFNDFMIDIHQRIRLYREKVKLGQVKDQDVLQLVAGEIAKETKLLCFDEFTVTDIADATILSRLFSYLFKEKVLLVATSNVEPKYLYHNGNNRELFLPFIDILQKQVKVINLDAGVDYRLTKDQQNNNYFYPLSAENKLKFENLWQEATKNHIPTATNLQVKGHNLPIDCAAGRAVKFDFSDLCDKPLAAAEYLALAKHYDVFFIYNLHKLNPSNRNVAKRFILFIDVLYDNKKQLIINAEVPPHELYVASSGVEAFEFDRTVSRLIEMQSSQYLESFVTYN